MKSKIRELTLLVVLAFCIPAFAGAGESAVITLTFPWGARANGMGEVGTSLADDESAAFWNPAGLGVPNERWRGGCASAFFEPVLPAFGLNDLWHLAIAGYYQPDWPFESGLYFGGFGFFINYLNLGVNEWTNDLGKTIGRAYSSERVTGMFCWGMPIPPFRSNPVSIGASLKFVRSALAPGYGADGVGIGRTIALDVGALVKTPLGIRAGLTFMNMGPSICYISRDESDPLPFTLSAAAGYKRDFSIASFRALQIASEYRISREFADRDAEGRPYPWYKALFTDWKKQTPEKNWRDVQHHAGIDIKIMNTGSLRYGYLLDQAGNRREFHYGYGISCLNHFEFDFYRIYSPKGSIVRHGQWGVSFSFFRIGLWQPADFHWWLAPNPE